MIFVLKTAVNRGFGASFTSIYITIGYFKTVESRRMVIDGWFL